MKKIIFYFLFIISFTSCSNQNEMPAGIIAKDKMQAVLWDVFQADAFTENFIKRDSTKNANQEYAKLQQKIFYMHKVNKESFDKSYAWYKSNPAVLRVMLDSITAKAEREKNNFMKVKYSRKPGQRK